MAEASPKPQGDQAFDAATLASKAAYGDSRAEGLLQQQGYHKDNDLSNEHYATFARAKDWQGSGAGHAIVAYRGTDLSKHLVGDLVADLGIIAGYSSDLSRFKRATETAKAAADKYGKDNVTLTGHSLGGSQALDASFNSSLPTVVFNPGVGKELVVKSVKAGASSILPFGSKLPEQDVYAVPYDIVPALAPLLRASSRVRYVKQTQRLGEPLGAHALANFLPDYYFSTPQTSHQSVGAFLEEDPRRRLAA